MMSKLFTLKTIAPLFIILVQTVNVYGQIWSTPVLTEEINGANSNIGAYSGLQIVNGNPALVYWDATHNNLMYRRSKDVLGADWEPAIVLDMTGDVGLTPSFEIVNGNPAVSYHDFSTGDLKYVLAKDVNGTEWYSPIIVDSNFEVGTYASMKIVNGNPAISYLDGTHGDLKYCRASDVNGFTWSAPISLDEAGYVGMFTSMQIVDGKPAIAYYNYVDKHDLKFIHSLDANGTKWASSVVLDETGDVGYYPSLQVIEGNPAVAYWDVSNGDLKYTRASDASGSSWPSPILIDAAGNTGLYPSLLTVDGFPAITYYSRTTKKLNYIRATDSFGTAWSAPLVIDQNGDVGIQPCLRIVEGHPTVAYQDNATGNLKYTRALNSTGQSWGTPISLSENGRSGLYPSLQLVNGNPAIACFGNTDLRYMRATNPSGTEWSKPVIVDAAGYVGQYASMKIIAGKPGISYFDGTNGKLKYVRAVDEDGTAWHTPVTVNRPGFTGIEGYYTSLEEVAGNPAVVFTNTESEKMIYMRADDAAGTSWSTYTYIGGEALGLGHYKSLQVVNGKPAISFYSIHGELNYVRANDALGTSWGEPISIDAITGSGMYSSLRIINGNPAISYYDHTNGNLKYIRATDPDGTTWNTPIVIESDGYVGRYTSLQIIDGNPAISYFDASTRYLKYVHALDPSGNAWASPVPLVLMGDPDTAPTSGDFGVYTSMIPTNDGIGIAYYNEIEQFPFFIGGIPCDLPTIPIVASTIMCLGESATLTVDGTLNDATQWRWYKDACGGSPIGEGDEITVTPETFTTYFVRGEGGCVPPGECKDVSVWVTEPPAKPVISLHEEIADDIFLTTTGGNHWQWFYNTEIIPGAIDSVYHVTSNGSYTVQAFIGTCASEMSDALIVNAAILCKLPTMVSVSAGSPFSCPGEATTLTVVGYLNDATQWRWYENSCGETLISEGAEITIHPETSTSYFLRGEGGCVPLENCVDILILVTTPPDKPIISLHTNTAGDIFLTTSGGTSYQWFNNGQPIAGATDSVYQVTTEGNFSVESFIGACGSEMSDAQIFDIATGIPASKEKVISYPNPAKDYLLVSLESFPSGKALDILIQDMLGRNVTELKASGKTILEVDVRNYPSGSYLILIRYGNQHSVVKFIKSK